MEDSKIKWDAEIGPNGRFNPCQFFKGVIIFLHMVPKQCCRLFFVEENNSFDPQAVTQA